MDLRAKLPDPGQTVLLYGTTPPRLAPDHAPARPAARRHRGLRHPGRDWPRERTATVPFRRHARPARICPPFRSFDDRLQSARHAGRAAVARLARRIEAPDRVPL